MSVQRILLITNRVPYPLNDGGSLAMHAMIRGYREAGLEVFVLSMNTARHQVPEEICRRLYPDLAGFEAIPFDNSIRIVSLLKNFLLSSLPEHAERFYHKDFEQKILSVIASFQPDLVQMESIFLSGYLPAIRSATGALQILRLHNVEYQIWQRLAGETRSVLKSMYLSRLAGRMQRYEEKVWRVYDLLLPITGTDAQIVRDSGCRTPQVTAPFGMDGRKLPAAVPELAAANWNGYHLGAMDWLPNKEAIDWFLGSVWPELHSKAPGFQFTFGGRNTPPQYFSDLPDGVACVGEVPDAEAFIEDKNILIVPLRSGGGIRVKILEAMAAGKLVISTALGMQGIEAIPGQHFMEADTPDAFAAAVSWCLSHREEAAYIAGNGAQLVRQQYTLQAITDNVLRQIGILQGR